MVENILVIDDEKSIRSLFSKILDSRGYNVSTAVSGIEALKFLEANTYQLILLDLSMPGMSGIDTLREIRKTDTVVPVYIITAFESAFFRELKEIRKEGIKFELLRKPISKKDLLMVVDDLLRK